jgi:hypothetical protein
VPYEELKDITHILDMLSPEKSGSDVFLEGSRQMGSWSRQYYDKSLGAGMFVSPVTENGLIGYSEPLRRFIQHEGFSPQVNEIANQMPSWIPGDDYLTNFHKGDPYIKVEEGYAPLPGAGYAALHPELEGVDPEDYPDIDKLRILGDVAPYSREYQKLHDRRRLGPSPRQHKYARARERRPSHFAMHSGVGSCDFTLPQPAS